MRMAEVYMHDVKAGILSEEPEGKLYTFEYAADYDGPPISVTMPVQRKRNTFDRFPPFFEGLLPEGANLEMLLRTRKIDRNDLFKILMTVGKDTVGAATLKEIEDEKMPDNL